MSTTGKIKILFRHRSMEMGGVEKVLLNVINNLDKDKFDITVLLNLNQGELRDEFPSTIKKLYLAKGKEDLPKNRILQTIGLIKRRLYLDKILNNPKKIDEEILNEKYDVEIAMTYNDFPLVLNSTNKNSKKIGWFHSEIQMPKLQPKVPMIVQSFPKFDRMIYCSQKIMDLMHQYYPSLNYPPEKVIINAIPTKDIREKSLEEIDDFPLCNVPTFVSVGRLHTRKGYHKLMQAHAKLIKDGFPHSIVIVGDGEEKQNLIGQTKELNVEDSFHLLGSRMNPYSYMKRSDFYVLSSESEAWPLVLAEALILKKPTIATDCGDVADVLDDKKTGLLINYTVEEMYKAMKEFLTEPNLIQTFQKNLQTIDEKFDNQVIFDEIETTILDVLNDD